MKKQNSGCKECGALCDPDVGLCPSCLATYEETAEYIYPNCAAMYERWHSEGKTTEAEFASEIESLVKSR